MRNRFISFMGVNSSCKPINCPFTVLKLPDFKTGLFYTFFRNTFLTNKVIWL